jgi:hypothetical protein
MMDVFKGDLSALSFPQRLGIYRNCVLSWVRLRRRIRQLYAMAKIYLHPDSDLYRDIKYLENTTPVLSGDYGEASRQYRQLRVALNDLLTKEGF